MEWCPGNGTARRHDHTHAKPRHAWATRLARQTELDAVADSREIALPYFSHFGGANKASRSSLETSFRRSSTSITESKRSFFLTSNSPMRSSIVPSV